MEKIQTFMIYFLIIIVFFLVSTFLEGQLIEQMYFKLDGSVQENFEYAGENLELDIKVLEAKATKMNGYLTARVINNTNRDYMLRGGSFNFAGYPSCYRAYDQGSENHTDAGFRVALYIK